MFVAVALNRGGLAVSSSREMDGGEFEGDFAGILHSNARASSEIGTEMNVVANIDFASELRRMERNIDYYKSKLRSCRDKYERVEMKIRDARQLQRAALLVLDNARIDEDLHERLSGIHLSCETTQRTNGREDPNETIRAQISELAVQRSTLMEELMQLRKNANENGEKLAWVNAVVTEQEEKNASLFGELKRGSEEVASVPRNIQERINAVLE